MATPGPGWYPAPDGEPYERWWDGTQWAANARPLEAPPVTPHRMVTYQPVRTSHGVHLVMTFLTLGLWAPFVWLPLTIINSLRRRRVVTRLD